MKARPILFSGAMVRSLLSGSKTQTRRAIKPQPHHYDEASGFPLSRGRRTSVEWKSNHVAPDGLHRLCPYGVPGDLLWVREGIQVLAYDAARPKSADIIYLADEDGDWRTIDWSGPHHVRHEDGYTVGRRTPSIHMPRAASRLTLEITDVRVERLNEISDNDAEAEGCPPCPRCGDCGWINSGPDGGWQCDAPGCGDAYRDQYARLWDQINGPGAWAENPWVWAVSFAVHQQNVDALLREREAA